MDCPIALRAIAPVDLDFLYRVYASTRTEELALVDWDEEQKAAFLQMQFNAQHQYYQANYSNAQFQLILLNQEPVGRLYVARWSNEIRIIDLALLPEYRDRGIGSWLLKLLLAEGEQQGLPVRIHVERYNRALGLYHRLGFQLLEDKGIYLFLEWTPVDSTSFVDVQESSFLIN